MNIPCLLAQLAGRALTLYVVVLLVYAIVSWFPDLRRGRWVYYLAALVEPILQPLRRVIPPLGGLDLSFLVLILVIQLLLQPALANTIGRACYAAY